MKIKFFTLLLSIIYFFIFNHCLAQVDIKSRIYNAVTMDSRIKTYVYSDNEVFPLTTHYGYITHLELHPNETILDILVGDKSSWVISTLRKNKISIRANEENAHTNMIILTSARTYNFDLFAKPDPKKGADLQMTYSIKFYHPPSDEDFEGLYPSSSDQEEDLATSNTAAINSLLSKNNHYDFQYSGSENAKPLVTFTDGKLTYFKFKGNSIPEIYEKTTSGRAVERNALDMVEYNGYIIVNSSSSEFILKLGSDTANVFKR